MGVKQIGHCEDNSVKINPFPKLMKNWRTGGIGIFTHPDRMTMLVPGSGSNMLTGQRSRGSIEPSHWIDYNEPLTLQNE